MGKSGIADRWQDLAICIRELDGVFSNEYVEDFDYSMYSSDMLLKEKSVTDIPEGLTSEYEWNN